MITRLDSPCLQPASRELIPDALLTMLSVRAAVRDRPTGSAITNPCTHDGGTPPERLIHGSSELHHQSPSMNEERRQLTSKSAIAESVGVTPVESIAVPRGLWGWLQAFPVPGSRPGRLFSLASCGTEAGVYRRHPSRGGSPGRVAADESQHLGLCVSVVCDWYPRTELPGGSDDVLVRLYAAQ